MVWHHCLNLIETNDELVRRAQCFKTIGEILSIPLALLESRQLRASSTSCSVIETESRWLLGIGRLDMIGRVNCYV